jgi:membrane peptidoglycan carboxypeptidase
MTAKSAPKRSAGARLGKAVKWVGGAALAVAVGAAAFFFAPLPLAAAVAEPLLAVATGADGPPASIEPPAERSVVLAADGTEIASLSGAERRVRVGLDEVADELVDAVLAIEDTAFRDHAGINHRRIGRAAVGNVRAGEVTQGGSTITQQYVKNALLSPRQTFRRKAVEALYAIRLEERLSKDEILERYLNEAYFGEGAYGIGTAASYYYDLPAGQLDLSQAALLAGLIRAPESTNPVDARLQAKNRRNVVLDRMAEEGFVSASAAQTAKREPIELDLNPPEPSRFPFVVEYVKQQLFADPALGETRAIRQRRVFTDGLRVTTTLDIDAQQAALQTITSTLTDPARQPQAALATVEPGDGAVRALAIGPKPFGVCPSGASECPRTKVNPAVPSLGGSGRQPGSAFKPFVITAALGEGVPPGWQQETTSGQEIPGCTDAGSAYTPSNYNPPAGGLKDMYTAVRLSNNVYHAKLIGLISPQPVRDVAERAGLRDGELPEQCSLALGSATVYPLQMASAFATFASGGEHCKPYVVAEIAGGDEQLLQREPDCRRVFEEERMTRLTDILRGPVAGGTATAAQLQRPVAGKTGTTQNNRDAWFVGYVPQLATAAWMGYEQPEPMQGVLGVGSVTGGSIPAQLWADYMSTAVADLPVRQFPQPGPQESAITPDISGRDIEELRREFDEDESYRFNLMSQEVADYREPGTVVEQSPAPTAEVTAGHALIASVSDGTGEPPQVPDVTGLRLDTARRRLAEAEYEVEVQRDSNSQPSPSASGGFESRVVGQEPDGGTELEPGETVAVSVERVRAEPATPSPTETTSPSPSPSESPSSSPSPQANENGVDAVPATPSL